MLIKARLHQNHCQARATGRCFFKLHQRKKFSIQLARYREKQKHIPASALSWGSQNQMWRPCARLRNVGSISYSVSTFSHHGTLLSWHCFADCNHKVLLYELLYQENDTLCTAFVRVCNCKRTLINPHTAPSSTQHSKHKREENKQP